MSLYFYEPFFTVSDFRRIFDDAFSGVVPGGIPNLLEGNRQSNAVTQRGSEGNTETTFRPV